MRIKKIIKRNTVNEEVDNKKLDIEISKNVKLIYFNTFIASIIAWQANLLISACKRSLIFSGKLFICVIKKVTNAASLSATFG